MVTECVFNLISRLVFSRWVSGYDEHHSPYEEACTANLGPLRLSVNYCFVLDHRDAGVSLTLPLPGGKLHLSYTVCLGEEPIRPSGWAARRQRPYRPTPPTASSEEFLFK